MANKKLLTSFITILLLFIFSCDNGTDSNENRPPQFQSTRTPANSAVDQALNISLIWTCSDSDGDPMTFDVYFGMTATPPLVSGGQSEYSHDVSGLTSETTYYWYIVAKDGQSDSTVSAVWSFTTISSATCNADNWGTAVHLFNDMYDPSLTQDGLTMYMYNSGTNRIYVSVKSGGVWGTPTLLPTTINGSGSTVVRSPSITGDGNRLYFVNDFYTNPVYYYSDKIGGVWQTPQQVSIDLTGITPHDNFRVSWDGNEFWFTGADDQSVTMDIFHCHYNGSVWSSPTKLFTEFTDDYNEYDFAISSDGNTLYFDTGTRIEITGSYSIWVSCKIGGVWQEPVPMGSTINMANYRERYTPEVSYDGSILYFSAWEVGLPIGIFMSNSTNK